MVKVIIMGAGKAGFLHLNSYFKMLDNGVIKDLSFYVVDPKECVGKDLNALFNKYNISCKVWPSLEVLCNKMNLTIDESFIINLCLPSGVLCDGVHEVIQRGGKNLIIEKPFIINDSESNLLIEKLKDTNFFMVKNYLYSFVYSEIQNILYDYSLVPEMLISNFSKDRVSESFAGRAFNTKHNPTVFEIELPHQIYLAEDLMGRGQFCETIYCASEDMEKDQAVIPDHGCGIIVDLYKNNKIAIHYSNLQHNETVRSMDILFNHDYILHAIFYPICEELKDINAGVVLLKNNKVISKKLCIGIDDNMYNMFCYAIDGFLNHKKEKLSNINDLIYSSDRLKDVVKISKESINYFDEILYRYNLSFSQMSIINSYAQKGDIRDRFIKSVERLKMNKLSEILPSMFSGWNTV